MGVLLNRRFVIQGVYAKLSRRVSVELIGLIFLNFLILLLKQELIVFKVLTMELLPLILAVLLVVNDCGILLERLQAREDAARLIELDSSVKHIRVVKVDVLLPF